jgi:urea ABC transporter urea binding protein
MNAQWPSADAQSEAPTGEAVKIGLLHSLSGTMRLSEKPLLDAELLAIDEINHAGGVLGRRIEPVIADGASLPEDFARAARALLGAGVRALFGCWTSASRKAVRPLVEAADSQLWYPVQYEGLEASPCICYSGSCLNQQIIPAVEWALEQLGKRLFLVGSDYVFPRTANRLIHSVAAGGAGTIVAESYVALGAQDFGQTIAQIRQTQPTVVISTLNGDSNLAFYRQYRTAGFLPTQIPVVATSVTETELESVASEAAGHYACWSYFQSLDLPESRAFVRRFKERYGDQRLVSAPAVTAYTQIYLWKQAAERAGTLAPSALRRCLPGCGFLSPMGEVRLEANHHLSMPVRIGRLQGSGQFEIVWRRDELVAPLPWLGVEAMDFPGKAMVLQSLAAFSEAVDYGCLLEHEVAERKTVEAALQRAKAESDDKVRERTRQLAKSIEDLKQQVVERRRGEAIMAARVRLLQLPTSCSLGDLLRATLDEAEMLTSSQVGFYHFVEADQISLSLQAWSTNTTQKMCKAQGAGLHYSVDQAGVWVDCIRERRPVIHNDYLALPHRKGLPEGHSPVIRELVVPVTRGGLIVAVLGVGNRPTDYRETDVETVSSLADLAWDLVVGKRAEEALRAASRHARNLIETSLDPLVTINAEGQITDVNAATEKITGIERKRLIGTDFTNYFTEPDRARAGYLKAFAQGQVHDYPLTLRHALGRLTEVLYNASVYRNEHGEVLGVFAAARDVTQRKRAEEEKERLEAQNRQLQKAESLGRMAGAIAHHFNNQLQSVMLNLELARRQFSVGGVDATEFLSDAAESAQKAAEVSSLMLTYLGQTTGKRGPQDLAEVCRRNLPMLQASVPKGVVLEVALPSPGPVILANSNQIQQLLANLITNAWEALGKGQGTVRLTVKTVAATEPLSKHRVPVDWQPEAPSYACLEVADSGCGITEQDRERLFDPFFSRKFAGRGLGLPVVLGIARAHQGAITVASEPDRGSIFQVLLPLSAEAVATAPVQVGRSPETRGDGLVLLVEDDRLVRRPVAGALTQLGFTVLQAQDGVEALELFRERSSEIRCVILDLTMPRMGGWETLQALRALMPGLPVILTSGYDEARALAGEHPEKPQVFLGKPYEFAQLREAIARVLVRTA